MTYKIIYETGHSSTDTQILYSGLAAYAKKAADMQPIKAKIECSAPCTCM